MLISSAWAASEPASQTTAMTAVPGKAGPAAGAPSAAEAFAMNMGLVALLVVMFYLLLIRPQQKRFKEHASMLSKLDKGSKIVTQGGLVGVIDKDVSEHEVLVDFGNGMKMTVMRTAIMGRYEDAFPKKAANDDKKNVQDKAKK